MTLTYLRGWLSICSVVWVDFRYFSLKFRKILMQLCKISFKTLKTMAHTFFFESRLRLRNPFSGVCFCCTCLQLYVLV